MDKSRQPENKPVTLAALARSFCELEECKRKLRMKPLPKAIDVSKNAKHRRAEGTEPTKFTEPDAKG